MDLRRGLLIVLSVFLTAAVTSSCAGMADNAAANFLAQAGNTCVSQLAGTNTLQDFDPAARASLPLACQYVIASDDVVNATARQSELGVTLVNQGVANSEAKLMEVAPTLCFKELGASGATYSFQASQRSLLPLSCQYGYGQGDLEVLIQRKLDLELQLSQQYNATVEAQQSTSSTATP